MLRRALFAVCFALALCALPASASAATDTLLDYGSGGWTFKAVPGGTGSLEPDATWTGGGTLPFGSLSTCSASLPAPTGTGGWTNTNDLLLSRTFDAPAARGAGSVSVRVDNDVTAYLNGELLGTATHEGCANVDPPAPLTFAAGELKATGNVIALRARDRLDQRYIDVRVQAETTGFSVSLAPGTVPAGATRTVTATITNSSPGTLDAVTLDPPAGLGDPVELTGLGLAPGATGAASFPVTAACSAGGGVWSASTAGLTLLGAAPSTAVEGDCAIAFATAPASARVGARITGTAFTPGAAPVAVQVLDGDGDPAADGTPVSVALADGGTDPGVLAGTTTQPTSGGAATFGDLSIDAPGGYRLTASAPGAGSATSDGFRIEDAAVVCTVNCTTEVANATTAVQGSATSSGGPAFLSLSLNVGAEPDCAGYSEFSPDWVLVNGSANLTEKLITYKISYRTLFGGWQRSGLSRVQACFSAPYAFATRAGYPAAVTSPIDGDGDGTPETWWTGILRECRVLGATRTPPCVSSRSLVRDGITVTVRMPGGAIDPKMRG